MTVPDIHYARSGDVHIAFQTFGSGPSLVGVPPFMQNLEALWDDPSGLYPRFLNRLAGFGSTVTHFDKRRLGLSDRVPGLVGIEDRMDDFRAVMDAAGIERACDRRHLRGRPARDALRRDLPRAGRDARPPGHGGPLRRGRRVRARSQPGRLRAVRRPARAHWATPESLLCTPSCPRARGRRVPAVDRSLRAARRPPRRGPRHHALRRRDRRARRTRDDPRAHADHPPRGRPHRPRRARPVPGRAHPGARYVELAGLDHVPWVGDVDAVLDAKLEEFLTGERPRGPETDAGDVLFTDIVGSTERAAELGDGRSRATRPPRHERPPRGQSHRGCVVKSTATASSPPSTEPGAPRWR